MRMSITGLIGIIAGYIGGKKIINCTFNFTKRILYSNILILIRRYTCLIH
jgi:hypothetical protein